jgi:hypothetical protein
MRKKRNYWNIENAFEVALKFNNKSDFSKSHVAAYELLRKNKLLDKACSHMTNSKSTSKWTHEKCKEVALSYRTRTEFKIKNSWAYVIAKRNGWLNDITFHMVKYNQIKSIKWTFESCEKEALMYYNRNEFYIKSPNAYAACIRNKWLDKVCEHMNRPHTSQFKWSKEKCQEIALKHNYRKEFQKKDKNAYYSAMHNGWLKIGRAHV